MSREFPLNAFQDKIQSWRLGREYVHEMGMDVQTVPDWTHDFEGHLKIDRSNAYVYDYLEGVKLPRVKVLYRPNPEMLKTGEVKTDSDAYDMSDIIRSNDAFLDRLDLHELLEDVADKEGFSSKEEAEEYCRTVDDFIIAAAGLLDSEAYKKAAELSYRNTEETAARLESVKVLPKKDAIQQFKNASRLERIVCPFQRRREEREKSDQ